MRYKQFMLWAFVLFVYHPIQTPFMAFSAASMIDTFSLPEIDVLGDVILKPGDNATIKCLGTTPLQWKWEPANHPEQKNYPDTNVFSSELMALDSGNYQRFLHFTQAQFFNTGQYFCDYIYNETSTPPLFPYCEGEPPTVETSVFRASVKVFVSDAENMFVKVRKDIPSNIFPIPVAVYLKQHTVLPCIVSDPSFHVTLERNIGPEDVTNYKNVLFNPIEGFILLAPDYSFSGDFKCKARSTHNETEEVYLRLNYKDMEMVPKPVLLQSSYFVIIGETFNLTCYIYVKHREDYFLRMIYKQKNDTGRIEVDIPTRRWIKEGSYDYDEIMLFMSVKNAELTDSGVYACKVEGLPTGCAEDVKITEVIVNVIEKSFVKLKPKFREIRINDTLEIATLHLTLIAYPLPTLVWYYNDVQLVDSIQYQMSYADKLASLSLLGPKSTHSGTYRLNAYNKDANESAEIKLYIYVHLDTIEGRVQADICGSYRCRHSDPHKLVMPIIF